MFKSEIIKCMREQLKPGHFFFSFGPGNEAKHKAIPKDISSLLPVLLRVCSTINAADAIQYSVHIIREMWFVDYSYM